MKAGTLKNDGLIKNVPPPCVFHFVEMQSAFCVHVQNELEFFN